MLGMFRFCNELHRIKKDKKARLVSPSTRIIKTTTGAPQAPSEGDVHAKLAFLNFSSAHLAQSGEKAEILKLSQLGHFLSMAAIETTKALSILQAQLNASGLSCLGACRSLPLSAAGDGACLSRLKNGWGISHVAADG
jgi:hypothetical protein